MIQIIQYLNKIEAEQKLVEKIRRIKYLKDQLVWEQSTDVIFFLQTYRPAFLEKRPWYNCLPSLDDITNTPDGIAALKEAHKALKHPVAKRKTDNVPLSPEELQQGAVVKDILNTFRLRSAFLGGSQDLMSFIGQYRFGKMDVTDARVLPLIKLIHHYQKGYDQEGYIE